MYDVAAAAMTGHTEYLEQIADRIATGALSISASIRSTRVAVRKPHVPLPGPLDYAEVVIERAASAT
jgi:dihydroneopterin aldolase